MTQEPTTTEQWTIRLFGTLEIEGPNGERISLQGRKCGELLAYLALHPLQAHPRNKLTAILWGTADVEHDRTRLRQEIAAIRGLFPAGPEDNPLIEIARTQLQLRGDVVVDANRFLECCETAKRESDPTAKAVLLMEAKGLYRADLLEEYEATWVVEERERIRAVWEGVEWGEELGGRNGTHGTYGTYRRVTPKVKAASERLRSSRWMSWVGVVLIGLFVVLAVRGNRKPPAVPKIPAALGTAIPRFGLLWQYPDARPTGQVQDSEGTAIVADETGIYVTGLMSTPHDDKDMLTMRLWHDGARVWAQPFTSDEHECDRAYSLCLDGDGFLYVLGQTYVPTHQIKPEGWYLTLLKYDLGGHPIWDRRSTFHIQDNPQLMQVLPDGDGGCFVASTALEEKKHAILIARYNGTGDVIWQEKYPFRTETQFKRMSLNGEGSLVVCGLRTHGNSGGTANAGGLVFCVDRSGAVEWDKPLEGSLRGADEVTDIRIDRAGAAYVCGIFDSGSPAKGGKGRQFGLAKFTPDGQRLWFQKAEHVGPSVRSSYMSVNGAGDAVVGGTEHGSDGVDKIVIVWFDSAGTEVHTKTYPVPKGYSAESLSRIGLFANRSVLILGQVTRQLDFSADTRLLVAKFSPDGQVLKETVFGSVGNTTNFANDFAEFDGSIFLTGQVGVGPTIKSLSVQRYAK